MNNPFATLEEASADVVHVRRIRTIHKSRISTGLAVWERLIHFNGHTLRIINKPCEHFKYQAQLTVAGRSAGRTWSIRKDAPNIHEWLESIKNQILKL